MIAEMATNTTSQGTCAAETPKLSSEMSPQVKIIPINANRKEASFKLISLDLNINRCDIWLKNVSSSLTVTLNLGDNMRKKIFHLRYSYY